MAPALFVENFYKPLFKPEAADKHYLTTGRIVALILVVFGIIIALYFTSVVAIIRLSWSLVAFFGIAFLGRHSLARLQCARCMGGYYRLGILIRRIWSNNHQFWKAWASPSAALTGNCPIATYSTSPVALPHSSSSANSPKTARQRAT